ncbi:putative metalloprotease [Kribbella amoyensis]|uniref:Putative metalloprotease n=1 Tax=Kribbella amoyensis TaxID=996641 RepID=A0A561BSN6_9ACTN|nr:neutral zinc metallopeptidase [Kribbella amoyensis]TWD81783.1 putative metalloprotease [Kribbella amoyensis]
MATDGAPKPGHFLPGNAPEPTTVPAETAQPEQRPGTVPLTAPTPRLGANAPDGPPLLSGSRLGPPPPGDKAAAAFKALYSPDPLPFAPKKTSKALIAAIVAGVLVLIGGGVALGTQLLSSYDDFVANPLGTPSLRPTDVPADAQATDAAGESVSDPELTRQNKLYAVGRLPSVGCKEPQYRPTSKDNVRAYYETLLTCLNKAWEPAVRKAGADFRAPRLIIFDDGQETACGVQRKLASYCPADGGSVAMPWQELAGQYERNNALTRVDMADALGYVYGVHVQNLTGIFTASDNLADSAPTEAARLEQLRRLSLQASCLSSVFLGAEQRTFPIRGRLLTEYQWRSKHYGDEDGKDKVRDHGSRKSVELWRGRGFGAADPGSCNTFVAAAGQVG